MSWTRRSLKLHPRPHFGGLEKQDQMYDDRVSRSDSFSYTDDSRRAKCVEYNPVN